MGGGNGMPNGSNCPLYIVTGASGVGKSALCREMAKIQSGYIVLDSDLLWDEIYNTPEDGYRRYRETWMTLCAAISDAGHPVVLCGCATPGQFEACDARRLFTEIRTIALVARPPAAGPAYRRRKLDPGLPRFQRLARGPCGYVCSAHASAGHLLADAAEGGGTGGPVDQLMVKKPRSPS